MEEKIRGIFIFEMLGRPREYLKDTIHKFTEKLSDEKGIEVLNKKINEPKIVKESKQELYTVFAETELGFEDMTGVLKVIFVYMPSHVEITSPKELKIKNFELNTLMNELARKLHQYDEIAKKLTIEKDILRQKLQASIQGEEAFQVTTNVKPDKDTRKVKKPGIKKPRKNPKKRKDIYVKGKSWGDVAKKEGMF